MSVGKYFECILIYYALDIGVSKNKYFMSQDMNIAPRHESEIMLLKKLIAREALLTMTQQRTVPNVFIAGRHLITKDLCDLRDTPQPARSAKLDKWLLEGPPPPTAM